MLPALLKKIPQTGVIFKQRPSDKEPDSNELEPSEELIACAHDLITALEAKDSRRVAKAWNAMFEVREMEPHEEAEHKEQVSPHTYEAQNMKAGE